MASQPQPKYYTQLALISLLTLLVLLDRAAFALISQWREDQATNLWLGLTLSLSELVVGLANSKGIDNPNGMPLFSIPLTYLPGLVEVSWLLGVLQAGLAVAVVYLSRLSKVQSFLLSALLVCCVTLRSAGAEYWNQYFLVDINLLFFALLLHYYNTRRLYALMLALCMCLIPPALYLAGVLNSAAYGALIVFAVFLHPPTWNTKEFSLSVFAFCAVAGFFLFYTWLPFFDTVDQNALWNLSSKTSWSDKLHLLYDELLRFPFFIYEHVNTEHFGHHFHKEPALFSELSLSLGSLQLSVYHFQVGICVLCLLLFLTWGAVQSVRSKHIYRSLQNTSPLAFLTLSSLVFLLIVTPLSPVLGGPQFSIGGVKGRGDMYVQFLPFVLLFLFGTPLLIRSSHFTGKALLIIAKLNLLLFAAVNTVGGLSLAWDNYSYMGPKLTNSDVPLYQKEAVADFLAMDWKSNRIHENEPISVNYKLGGGRWDFVGWIGERMPLSLNNPFTMGRAFDYLLWKKHSIRNNDEGLPFKTRSKLPEYQRYVVSYIFDTAAKKRKGYRATHHRIGRYRVSIFKKKTKFKNPKKHYAQDKKARNASQVSVTRSSS